jgi:hypothetical protein
MQVQGLCMSLLIEPFKKILHCHWLIFSTDSQREVFVNTALVQQFLYIRNIPDVYNECIDIYTALTAFARYFVVLKSDECKTRVVHVGGNSQTVINGTRSNGFGKQSRQNWRKKPKHIYCDIIKKTVPVFIYRIYSSIYRPHIAILFVNENLFW